MGMKRLTAIVLLMLLWPAVPAAGSDRNASLGARAASARQLPPLTSAARDGLYLRLTSGRITDARYALERALSLFDLHAVRSRFGDVSAPRPADATMILRDLTLRVGDLSGADRRRAEALLARPTDGLSDAHGHGYTAPNSSMRCGDVCVHWVETTTDAVPLVDLEGGDSGANGLPDQVDNTIAALNATWNTEIDTYGFRPPKSDASSTNSGPDGKLDVYLADIGGEGLYGYCTSDDLNRLRSSGYQYFDLSAYCVLDNDYSTLEFSGVPLENLQVTTAHEFFHAVQFAYDAFEDVWLLEGTAAWMEDQVFDSSNDNLQFLARSPLSHPERPVDVATQGFEYGSWIFWRFMSEFYSSLGAHEPDPNVILNVWQRVDGAAGGPDAYSLQAIEAVANASRPAFGRAFSFFGLVNLVPGTFYTEGASYPSAPLAETFRLTRARPSTGRETARLSHLTNWAASVAPGRGVAPDAKLRVVVDGPPRNTGPKAFVMIQTRSGDLRYRVVSLSSAGDGAVTVPFGRTKIARIVVVLTNASTRYSCWRGTENSCQGVPTDDNKPYAFKATLRQ
jgi:hypothetical protein